MIEIDSSMIAHTWRNEQELRARVARKKRRNGVLYALAFVGLAFLIAAAVVYL